MTSSALRTLLKAACAASGLDEKEMAARAGVSTQRGYDIINERSIASDEEVVGLLTATGIPPDRVVDLIRDADDGAIAIELAIRIRACLGRDVDLEAALREATLKIDAFSLVADPFDHVCFREELPSLGFVEVPEPKRSKSLGLRYKHHLYIKDAGVGVQYDPIKREKKRTLAACTRKRRNRTSNAKPARYARIELTRFTPEGVSIAKHVLAMLDRNTHDVTRIDPAIDVLVPFNALHLMPSDHWKQTFVYHYEGKEWEPPNDRTRHARTYLGARGAESVYEFRRGGVLVRVYDWNQRHNPKGKELPPQTRVEAQLRFREKKIEQLADLKNPYVELCFVGGYTPGLDRADYVDGLVVRECGFYKPHLVLPRLSRRQRRRVERLLALGKPLSQPWRVFDASWKATLASFLDELGLR